MTKSGLIEALSAKQKHLHPGDVQLSINIFLDLMSETLAEGGRIEVRGFGSFSLRHHAPRAGRNPKTGESVQLPAKSVPHFKQGKLMRERINKSVGKTIRD